MCCKEAFNDSDLVPVFLPAKIAFEIDVINELQDRLATSKNLVTDQSWNLVLSRVMRINGDVTYKKGNCPRRKLPPLPDHCPPDNCPPDDFPLDSCLLGNCCRG